MRQEQPKARQQRRRRRRPNRSATPPRCGACSRRGASRWSGVSADPASFGARSTTNLRDFAGPVWTVNPKYAGQELHGRPCYGEHRRPAGSARLRAAGPAARPACCRRCRRRRRAARAASSSTRPATARPGCRTGWRRRRRCATTARSLGLPLVGVNCLGIVDHTHPRRRHLHAGIPAPDRAGRRRRHHQPVGRARLCADAGGGARLLGLPHGDGGQCHRPRRVRPRRLSALHAGVPQRGAGGGRAARRAAAVPAGRRGARGGQGRSSC